jgi:hypothetical protein
LALTLSISALLIVLTVFVHYEILTGVAALQRHWQLPARIELLAIFFPTLAAHLTGICLYALVFAWAHDHPELGSLQGNIGASGADFLYFSLTCYTTLGVGDVYATGPMRIISGFEALNGLLLIAWSASFTFVSIKEAAPRRD